MANTSNPFGFRFWGPKYGGGTYGLLTKYIAAGYGTALYRGDLVTYVNNTATGYIQQGAAAQGVKNAYNVGIFYGVEYFSVAKGSQIFSTYWPASDHSATPGGDGKALVIPLYGSNGPNLFEVQVDNSSGSPFTLSSVGSNVDIVVGTGTVTSGYAQSSMQILASSLATGQGSSGATGLNYPFRVFDLFSNYAAPGQNGADNTTAYNHVIVEPNPNIVATAGLY
jgi:hypothetical protein